MKHFIYFHHVTKHIADEQWYKKVNWLLLNEYHKINDFHRIQDKMNSFIGKLLLRKGLQDIGFSPDLVMGLKYSEQKRPYLEIPWDFNITHCDNLIAMVIAEKTRIGLDIEKIDKIDIADFRSCFTKPEWDDILSAEDKYLRFFYYWTRKEAVLKGIGSGLLINPSLFNAIENQVTWEQKTWFLHEIHTELNHVCHLATEDPKPEIIIQKISDPFIYC